MATHSSTLAWNIPWTEEPGRVQSMGSQRVGHDRANSLLPYLAFSVLGKRQTKNLMNIWSFLILALSSMD